MPGDSARRSSKGDFTIEGEFSVNKNHEESEGPELACPAAEIVDIGDAGTADPNVRDGDCAEEPVSAPVLCRTPSVPEHANFSNSTTFSPF